MDADFDNVPPRAGSIVESLRAFGYDLPTAVADIVDNSLSAEASRIWVQFYWAGSDSVVTVIDNGRGMSASELIEAMRFGSKHPLEKRAPSDLGRFGLGLKTASLSQCRRVTVCSKRNERPVETRCWDLDAIASCAEPNEWRLLRQADTEAERHVAPLHSLPHGTAVVWQQLDRLTDGQQTNNEKHHQRFLERVEGVRRHLGMVFHRLIGRGSDTTVFVNDRPVEPWDPFMVEHEATHRLPVDPLRFKGVRVPVQAYVLPHFSKLSKAQQQAGAGPLGWLAHQGFYVYRRNRLLVAGDWLGFGWTKDEHLKLARIAVDLPNELDHDWQINVTKSRATPPAGLREDLRRIAERARAEAKNVYTHRGAILSSGTSGERILLWETVAKHDRVGYRINLHHPLVKSAAGSCNDRAALSALLCLIEETVPVQHIAISAVEKPECHRQPFESADESQVRSVIVELYRCFRDGGLTHEEACHRIRNHWPFENYPALIASLETPPQ